MTGSGVPHPGALGFQIRSAREEDLDVIAGFEIAIARASFGDEAVEDPALHRKRVAGALGKPGEVTLVAVAGGAPGAPGTASSAPWPPPTSRAARRSPSCSCGPCWRRRTRPASPT